MRQFITKYLVSGPKITPFEHEQTDTNQIRYEQYLRSIIAKERGAVPHENVQIGAQSELGMPWEFYDSYGDYFLSIKQFSYTLTKTEVMAAFCLKAKQALTLSMALWSYGAIEIWQGDACICRMDAPLYKPMKRIPFSASLKKGQNLFLVRMICLGARDTRNMFGIELLDHTDDVTGILPDEEHGQFYEDAQAYLASIRLEENTLSLPPCGLEGQLFLTYETDPDHPVDLTGVSSYEMQNSDPHITLRLSSGIHHVSRTLERINQIVPDTETKKNPYEVLSQVCEGSKFEGTRLSLLYWMAGKGLDRPVKYHMECLDQALCEIERRADCSDFYMAALLRHIHCYGLPKEVEARAKDAFLTYRYWMTEEGSDGMCFWSENHSLLFFINAYMAGQLYPEERFLRSGRLGREQSEWALSCVRQWLSDVVEYGFDEFLSADYMCVTMGALLNVFDYAPEQESKDAKTLLDLLFHHFACHCYKGEIIAPQGRIYRSVLYPYTQNAQALMYLLDSDCPMAESEWLSFLLTTRYQIPYQEKEWIGKDLDTAYSSSNARIHLYKTKDYILTSVQSPRTDGGKMWSPVPESVKNDTSLDTLVIRNKAMNECFHGTSHFEPGTYGYQQHMCYAAIGREAVLFVNHPGETSDLSSMRPGYWYGNGLMPAMKQVKNSLGCIYELNDRHPVDFIHFFFPKCKFDFWKYDGNWLFASKDDSYIGIWCNVPLIPWNDLLADCEYRAYGGDIASFWQLGCRRENGSLEEFMVFCQELSPQFENHTLTSRLPMQGQTDAGDGRASVAKDRSFVLTYTEHDNPSQYV
ncbi:MAG: hypothetical protein ACLU6W_06095 [Lachnospiraceae bacterium]